MKKKIFLFLLFSGLVIEALVLAGKFISPNTDKLTNALEKTLHAEVIFNGKARYKFFPYPKLVVSGLDINDISISDRKKIDIKARIVEAKISVMNLLTGNITIKNLQLTNAKIDYLPKKENLEKKSANFNFQKLNGKIKNIKIVNSNFYILDEKNEVIRKLRSLNLNANISNQTIISANFKEDKNDYNLTGNINFTKSGNIASNFQVSFAENNMNIVMVHNQKKKKTNGDLTISGKNLKNFIFTNLITEWFFYPDEVKNSFNFDISFERSNKQFFFKKAVLKSDIISGEIKANLDDLNKNQLSFKLEYLDLDRLFTSKKKKAALNEMNFLKLNSKKSFLSGLQNKHEIFITGEIQNIILKEKLLGPLNLSLGINENNKIKLEELYFSLHKNNYNQISGFFNKNEDKYEFIGNVKTEGESLKKLLSTILPNLKLSNSITAIKYVINSNLSLTDNEIQLFNIDGKFAESSIKGDAILGLNNKETNSSLRLNFDKFNLDEFKILGNKKERLIINHFINKLTNKENNTVFLQNFLWLRNLYNKISFQIEFKNSKYNNQQYQKISLKGSAKHRYFNLEKFLMLSDKNDFNLNMIATLEKTIPEVSLNINAKKIHEDLFKDSKNLSQTKIWSNKLVQIPNFSGVEFSYKSKFDNISYKDLQISDANFAFEVKNDFLEIQKLSSKLNGGDISIGGGVILDGLPTFNLTYKLKNVQMNPFLTSFFNNNLVRARANIAGKLNTYGNTPYLLIKQLKSENNFYLADVIIERMAIRKILQEVANLSFDPSSAFKTPPEELILQGNTKFSYSKGRLNIVNGVAQIKDIKLLSQNIEGELSGDVNFLNKTLKIGSVYNFNSSYKVKSTIKKQPIVISHTISGSFKEQQAKYNLTQINKFVDSLKIIYLKLSKQKRR